MTDRHILSQWEAYRPKRLGIVSRPDKIDSLHSHKNEDELFSVFKTRVTTKLRDEDIVLSRGEISVVAKGVEHYPLAGLDTHFIMIEPASTKRAGKEKVKSLLRSAIRIRFDA